MSGFHFFTEVDLFSQTPSQSYGPVIGNEETKYRVTSKFSTLMKSKAFAVCDGIVFVQPQIGNNLYVNLILKPLVFNGQIKFTNVEYFIYRGLKKENFVSSSNQLPAKNSLYATQLIDSIYEDETIFKIKDLDFNAGPEAFGWDIRNLPETTLLTKIFYEKNSDFQLKVVNTGCILGYFDQTNLNCGFEIVLKDKLYLPTLKIARDIENIIEVPILSTNEIAGNEPINRMRIRELILNYVDPAAFFMHCKDIGVRVERSNSVNFSCSTYDQIYLEIVNKFATSNTIYVDIRNENGYSLNYYKDNGGEATDNDFGKHIQFSENGSNFNFINYYQNYWPIFSIILPNNYIEKFSIFYIKFRKFYNPNPLLYLDVCLILNANSLVTPKSNEKFISESPSSNLTSDWTSPFEFAIPNNSNLSQTTHHAWYVKLYLLVTEPSVNIIPSTTIRKNNFLDNVFGNLLFAYDKININNTQWETSTVKKYIIGQLEFGTSGMYEIKIGVSSSDVLFSAILLDPYVKTLKSFPSKQNLTLETTASGSSIDGEISSSLINGIFANNNVEFNKIKFTTFNEEFYIHYIGSSDQENSEVHSNFTLLLSKSQFQSIIDEVENLNLDLADVMIQFVNYDYKIDSNLKIYQVANVKLIGLDVNGNTVQINTNLETKIYNGNRYNTSDFGNSLNIIVRNKDPFTFSELINLVRSVEVTYSNPNKLTLDDTPNKTVTRIRVHYYGYPGSDGIISGLTAIAFNKGVPSSPYIEKNPYSVLTFSPSTDIPQSVSTIILNSVTSQRIRMLYKTFDDKNNNQRFELKKETYDRITASQSLKLGNNIIDIGHAFYGLDCLLHTSNSEHPAGKPAKPFRNSLPTEGFDIQHSIDFTSFIGDLASVLGNAYLKYQGRENLITTAILDGYYENPKTLSGFFSQKDQLGDVDIIGLKKAWDKLSSINPNFKFSDVIEFYYGPITNNHHPIIPEHHSKRFMHFAKYYGLVDNAGVWFDDATPEMQNIKADWNDRVKKFAVFYYGSRSSRVKQAELVSILLTNGNLINTTNWFRQFSNSHINYLTDRFLKYLKDGYINE